MTARGAGAPAYVRRRPIRLGRGFSRLKGNFTWVYLWGAPLRAMHWVAALCVVTLIITGLYIGRPYFMTSGEASAHFLMGRVRFVHFMAAGVLVMTGIVRIYWLFAGNRFERFPALFAVTPRNLKRIARTTGAYLTFNPDKEPLVVGHDPLQQIAYTTLYLMVIIAAVTGFTMYGQSNPGGIIFQLFSWVAPLVGGLQNVRLIHHMMTWLLIVFALIHIYFVVRSDYVERIGRVSSMITGGRYFSTDEQYEDYDITEIPAAEWHTSEHAVPKSEK